MYCATNKILRRVINILRHFPCTCFFLCRPLFLMAGHYWLAIFIIHNWKCVFSFVTNIKKTFIYKVIYHSNIYYIFVNIYTHTVYVCVYFSEYIFGINDYSEIIKSKNKESFRNFGSINTTVYFKAMSLCFLYKYIEYISRLLFCYCPLWTSLSNFLVLSGKIYYLIMLLKIVNELSNYRNVLLKTISSSETVNKLLVDRSFLFHYLINFKSTKNQGFR